MARKALTKEEQKKRNQIKEIAEVSGVPFKTLVDYATKKEDNDYRQFIYFMLASLGTDKIEELRKQYEKFLKTPKKERNF